MAQQVPSVAVIMRTRDRPLLLDRAVADVGAQTWTDWRLVVVNDGGVAADVEEVIRQQGSALAGRVIVIHNDVSRGVGAACNQGIKASDSAFIAIHDDDDTWHPTFLQRTVAHLDTTTDAAVAVRTEIIWEYVQGQEVIEHGREIFPPDVHSFSLFEMLRYNRTIPISVLYRRAIHDEVGYLREDLPAVEDWEFYLRLALTTHSLGFLDGEPLAFWHQRRAAQDALANSVIARDSDHRAMDLLVREEALRAYARQNGLGGLLYTTKYLEREIDQLHERMQRHEEEVVRRLARLEAAVSDASLVSLALRLYRRLKARLRHVRPADPDPARSSAENPA
ncbi:MAG: glycosyltransferase [Streptosporangiaceae bacterium]